MDERNVPVTPVEGGVIIGLVAPAEELKEAPKEEKPAKAKKSSK